jgi:hypothetical protein
MATKAGDTSPELHARRRWLMPLAALLVCVVWTSGTAAAAATNVYVAQASAGAANGSSCANAYPISFFGDGANWGSGANQIGPGTTVHLCGAIATNLTFQASGSSGSPVVLDGTGATLAGYIDVGTQYWTIQNVTYDKTWGTGSPTQAALQVLGGGAFGTVKNNTMDIAGSAQVVFLAHVSHDIDIVDNFMRITAPKGTGYDTDILDSEGSYNVLVEGNYLELAVTGDEACGDCHDDVTQVWAASGDSSNSPYNWTYRYNYFVDNSPGHVNNLSQMMMEAIGVGTPGYWNVYDNVFLCKAGGASGNGIVFDGNGGGMSALIYNNTVVESAGSCNNLFNLSGSGSMALENNLVYSTDSGNELTGGGTGTFTRANNLWYGAGAPSCVASEVCGKNPLFADYSTNDFSLQAASPAIHAGLNLGASYSEYPLPEATWPNPVLGARPASGPWDVGAYQYCQGSACSPADGGTTDGGGAPPAPPTNLVAVVH